MSSAYNTDNGNLATWILRHAETHPDRLALHIPKKWDQTSVSDFQECSYQELSERVGRLASGLKKQGFQVGDRVVLLFPVSIELYATVIALLALGITIVFIDPGMGLRKVLAAIKDSRARAIISVRALLRHRFWLPPLWRLKKYSFDSTGLFLRPFDSLIGPSSEDLEIQKQMPDDHALITFTSGSTGRPKGADRTHSLLVAQHKALRTAFPDSEDDVDMTCFPVSVLHNLCCGVTSVLPPVNFAAPASTNGALVLSQIRKYKITRVAGPPVYLDRLISHMESSGERSPQVRAIGSGGAPVPRSLCARTRAVFPQAECIVVYGSTEAEPMTHVSMDEILASEGEGFLVGTPASGVTIDLVSLPEPAPALDDRGMSPYRVKPGTTGEVVVSGPHVVAHYVDNPQADQENKLYHPNGQVFHRTGDLARFDQTNRLWLTGRIKDLIRYQGRQLSPLLVEARIDEIEGIERSALIAKRRSGETILLFELQAKQDENEIQTKIRAVLNDLKLSELNIRQIQKIPTDSRHNSKIDRQALT